MKNKILQFIRSADNLDNSTKISFLLGKKLKMNVELFLVIESQYTLNFQMAQPLKTGISGFQYDALMEEQKIRKAEKSIQSFLTDNKDIEGFEVKFNITTGIADLLLIDKSKEADTFLMVLNEVPGPENDFILKTYKNVLETAHCPVLKLPADYQKGTFVKILYATDYKDEDIPTLTKLSEIAKPLNAEITALHITYNKDLEEKLKSNSFEATIHEKVGYSNINLKIQYSENIEEGINDFAKESDTDLIVLLKENKNFFEKLFQDSPSKKILSKSELPVLVFHEER